LLVAEFAKIRGFPEVLRLRLQSDSDLAKFFPGIEGWPSPSEQAMADAVRLMYEQFSAQSASF